MSVWFTADSHFGHASMLEAGKGRPFASVEEMNAEIVRRWNVAVGERDDVWHLGDLWWRGDGGPQAMLEQLRGRKHLIIGNHDDKRTLKAAGWQSVQHYAEPKIEGDRVILFHYALRVWDRSHFGRLHFYGHSHGNLEGNSQSLDVGVDSWAFAPVGLAEIKARLATLPPWKWVDHHVPPAERREEQR